MVINNKQLYKITLTREQLMLISRCVEDISRYAAGDMDLQHTTETLIDDMDRTESLGIRSFIANNSMAIRRRLFPDLEDYEHIGYDGGSKDMINRKRLIGNTYQIYRSILHQLAIDENWNNVYSDMTLPSGDMGTIKVERVDDEYFSVEDHNSAIVLPKGTIRRLTGRDLKWEDDPISLKSVIEGLLHVDIEFYKQKIINFVKWI